MPSDVSDSHIPKQEYASLWREGLRLFCDQWRPWGKGAIRFFILFLPLSFFMIGELGPYYHALYDLWQTHPPNFLERVKALQKPNRFISDGQLLLYYVAAYFFSVFYLGVAPITNAPKASIGNLFATLWKKLLSLLIMIGWILLIMIVAIILAVGLRTFVPGAVFAVIIIAGFLAFFVAIWVMVRYACVMPLAIEGIQSPLRTSVAIVRGNIWRLIGNWLLLYLMILPLGVVQWAGVFVSTNYNDNNVVIGICAIFFALLYVISAGLFSAFICAATRIMYNEKRAADPNFILITRS